MPRGRPKKVIMEVNSAPKLGDARISVTVQHNGQTVSKAVEIRDYSGTVPGPQRNAAALADTITLSVKTAFGAVRDVP